MHRMDFWHDEVRVDGRLSVFLVVKVVPCCKSERERERKIERERERERHRERERQRAGERERDVPHPYSTFR